MSASVDKSFLLTTIIENFSDEIKESKSYDEQVLLASVIQKVLLKKNKVKVKSIVKKANAHRSPVGGLTIFGKFYPGGQFIPKKVMNKLSLAEQQAVQEGEDVGDVTPTINQEEQNMEIEKITEGDQDQVSLEKEVEDILKDIPISVQEEAEKITKELYEEIELNDAFREYALLDVKNMVKVETKDMSFDTEQRYTYEDRKAEYQNKTSKNYGDYLMIAHYDEQLRKRFGSSDESLVVQYDKQFPEFEKFSDKVEKDLGENIFFGNKFEQDYIDFIFDNEKYFEYFSQQWLKLNRVKTQDEMLYQLQLIEDYDNFDMDKSPLKEIMEFDDSYRGGRPIKILDKDKFKKLFFDDIEEGSLFTEKYMTSGFPYLKFDNNTFKVYTPIENKRTKAKLRRMVKSSLQEFLQSDKMFGEFQGIKRPLEYLNALDSSVESKYHDGDFQISYKYRKNPINAIFDEVKTDSYTLDKADYGLKLTYEIDDKIPSFWLGQLEKEDFKQALKLKDGRARIKALENLNSFDDKLKKFLNEEIQEQKTNLENILKEKEILKTLAKINLTSLGMTRRGGGIYKKYEGKLKDIISIYEEYSKRGNYIQKNLLDAQKSLSQKINAKKLYQEEFNKLIFELDDESDKFVKPLLDQGMKNKGVFYYKDDVGDPPRPYSNEKGALSNGVITQIYNEELDYVRKRMPHLADYFNHVRFRFTERKGVGGHFGGQEIKQAKNKGNYQFEIAMVSKFEGEHQRKTIRHEIAHAINRFSRLYLGGVTPDEINPNQLTKEKYHALPSPFDMQEADDVEAFDGHGRSWKEAGQVMGYEPSAYWSIHDSRRFPNDPRSKEYKETFNIPIRKSEFDFEQLDKYNNLANNTLNLYSDNERANRFIDESNFSGLSWFYKSTLGEEEAFKRINKAFTNYIKSRERNGILSRKYFDDNGEKIRGGWNYVRSDKFDLKTRKGVTDYVKEKSKTHNIEFELEDPKKRSWRGKTQNMSLYDMLNGFATNKEREDFYYDLSTTTLRPTEDTSDWSTDDWNRWKYEEKPRWNFEVLDIVKRESIEDEFELYRQYQTTKRNVRIEARNLKRFKTNLDQNNLKIKIKDKNTNETVEEFDVRFITDSNKRIRRKITPKVTKLKSMFEYTFTKTENGYTTNLFIPNELLSTKSRFLDKSKQTLNLKSLYYIINKSVELKNNPNRSPPGGVNVNGVFYPGGQFIPKEVLENLSEEEKEGIAEGRDVGDVDVVNDETMDDGQYKASDFDNAIKNELSDVIDIEGIVYDNSFKEPKKTLILNDIKMSDEDEEKIKSFFDKLEDGEKYKGNNKLGDSDFAGFDLIDYLYDKYEVDQIIEGDLMLNRLSWSKFGKQDEETTEVEKEEEEFEKDEEIVKLEDELRKQMGKPIDKNVKETIDLNKKIDEEKQNSFKRGSYEATINSEEFKNWFGNSKVVDKNGSAEITYGVDYDTNTKGKPIIVFHGTTHEFNEFTLQNANIQNDVGRGFYFTSSKYDASSNYLSDGADLTNRIENLAVQLEMYDDKYEDWETALNGARERLVGDIKDGKVMMTFLKMENPAILDLSNEYANSFSIVDLEPPNEDDEEFLDEDGEFDEYLYEEYLQDYNNQLYDAINREFYTALDSFESKMRRENIDIYFDTGDVVDGIVSNIFEMGFDNGTLSPTQLYNMLKGKSNSSTLEILEGYDENNDEGVFLQGELFNHLIQHFGFDGIIYEKAKEHFPNMEMSWDSKHYVSFDSSNIKSISSENFDKNEKNIYKTDEA